MIKVLCGSSKLICITDVLGSLIGNISIHVQGPLEAFYSHVECPFILNTPI